MSDEDDDQDSGLDALVTFARAVSHPTTRRAALTDVGLLMGKFALPCVAVVVAVAAPQIHGLGFSTAWRRFGAWWVLWPVVAGLVPVGFALARAAIDAAVRVVVWTGFVLLYVVPTMFVGEERADRWLARAKMLPLVAFAGFVLWCAWAGGADSVTRGHLHPATPTDPSIDWAGIWHWLRTNPWMLLVGGVVGKGIAEIVKKWTATVADEITKAEPQRVVQIYGPDNTVVREVVVHDRA